MLAANLDRVRTAALPEASSWRDDGCEVAPRCLACPLPQCRFDVPLHVQRRRLRAAYARLRRRQGASVPLIAQELGCDKRTVFRVLNAPEQ